MQNDLQDILNSPYIKPEEVTRVAESFDAIVQNSLDTVDFMSEILSSDNLKMSRCRTCGSIERKRVGIKRNGFKYPDKNKTLSSDIISFRKMQDKVNNRETELLGNDRDHTFRDWTGIHRCCISNHTEQQLSRNTLLPE